jgi:hypothetical protein
MARTETANSTLPVILVLFLVTCGVTVWLFLDLTEPAARSATFGFTLAFACYLESLVFGYGALLMVPRLRDGIVAIPVPMVGGVLGLYLALSLGIILFVSAAKVYYTAVLIASLLFLLLLGALSVMNSAGRQ